MVRYNYNNNNRMNSQVEPDNSSSNQYEVPLFRDQKTPVYINVYDMLPKGKIADIGYMFGIGVFHSGVEVYDKEYNFGGHDFDSTGVFIMRPRIGPPNLTFKESVFMGHTSLSKEEVKNVIEELSKEWSGNSYNLLTRNCNHFTSDLCNILVGKPAPNWINRAAKLGTLFPCRFVYNKYICVVPQFTFILTLTFSMEPLINMNYGQHIIRFNE
ncbi:DUF862-domain-containing protein [Gigaspora margarita]|uniref:DUF862-domain-containing protein n=1 Tax=Gigaspora margarita TaxID=4874 RepID=A0A8H4AEB3_GIGMA|nr:DUF862-domain-containing protein [Gigaspora margarita]